MFFRCLKQCAHVLETLKDIQRLVNHEEAEPMDAAVTTVA